MDGCSWPEPSKKNNLIFGLSFEELMKPKLLLFLVMSHVSVGAVLMWKTLCTFNWFNWLFLSRFVPTFVGESKRKSSRLRSIRLNIWYVEAKCSYECDFCRLDSVTMCTILSHYQLSFANQAWPEPWTARNIPFSSLCFDFRNFAALTPVAWTCVLLILHVLDSTLKRKVLRQLVDMLVQVLNHVHPSPLSARTGFWDSKPFSQANAYLKKHGMEPVDWSLWSGISSWYHPTWGMCCCPCLVFSRTLVLWALYVHCL